MKKKTTFLLLAVMALICFNANAQVNQDSGSQGLANWGAENFDINTAGQQDPDRGIGLNSFVSATAVAGYYGDSYMTGEVEGVYAPVSAAFNYGAKLTYNINFTKTGTHYLWGHVYFSDGDNDSFYYGLDNEQGFDDEDDVSPNEGDKIQGPDYGVWKWDKGDGSFEIAEVGVHTITIYIRERKASIDHFLITTDSEYNPADSFTLSLSDNALAVSTDVRAVGDRIHVSNVKFNTEVKLYSFTGTLIKSIETNEDIDFNIESGLYIAVVKTNEGQKSVKLLVGSSSN